MATTTDIAGWLDENEPEDEQDRADLLASIMNVGEKGNYATTHKGGRLLVAGWSGTLLALANAAAKARLIREVESLAFDDGELRHAFRACGHGEASEPVDPVGPRKNRR